MAKTNDFELSKQYLMNYIQNIKKYLSQCQIDLIKHSQSCPITTLSFDQIEHGLKEFVDRERNYLSTRNNEQLIQFKNHIHEKDLFKIISVYSSQVNQQVILNQNYIFLSDRIF